MYAHMYVCIYHLSNLPIMYPFPSIHSCKSKNKLSLLQQIALQNLSSICGVKITF